MFLVVWGVAGVNRGPTATRVEVESAADWSKHVEGPSDQPTSRNLPKVIDAAGFHFGFLRSLPWFLTSAAKHLACDHRGGAVARIQLEIISARRVRPMTYAKRTGVTVH